MTLAFRIAATVGLLLATARRLRDHAAVGTPHDPLERVNRGTLALQRRARPRRAEARREAAITSTCRRVIRTGVGNFLENLEYPTTIVNDLLQGKIDAAVGHRALRAQHDARHRRPARSRRTRVGIPQHDEDFGQTLGRWGVPAGSVPGAAVPRAVHVARRAVAGCGRADRPARPAGFEPGTRVGARSAVTSWTAARRSWRRRDAATAPTTATRSSATPGCSAASTRCMTERSRTTSRRRSWKIRVPDDATLAEAPPAARPRKPAEQPAPDSPPEPEISLRDASSSARSLMPASAAIAAVRCGSGALRPRPAPRPTTRRSSASPALSTRATPARSMSTSFSAPNARQPSVEQPRGGLEAEVAGQARSGPAPMAASAARRRGPFGSAGLAAPFLFSVSSRSITASRALAGRSRRRRRCESCARRRCPRS